MFQKASLKLGLDKAVLQTMTKKASSKSSKPINSKEVEMLLKKGAYHMFMDDDDDGDRKAAEFCAEDIDQILQKNSRVLRYENPSAEADENGDALSSFSKASFVANSAEPEVDLDDPNFWAKIGIQAPKAVQQEVARRRPSRISYREDASDSFSASSHSEFEYDSDNSEDGRFEVWSKKERDLIFDNLLVFGYGRWRSIHYAVRTAMEARKPAPAAKKKTKEEVVEKQVQDTSMNIEQEVKESKKEVESSPVVVVEENKMEVEETVQTAAPATVVDSANPNSGKGEMWRLIIPDSEIPQAVGVAAVTDSDAPTHASVPASRATLAPVVDTAAHSRKKSYTPYDKNWKEIKAYCIDLMCIIIAYGIKEMRVCRSKKDKSKDEPSPLVLSLFGVMEEDLVDSIVAEGKVIEEMDDHQAKILHLLSHVDRDSSTQTNTFVRKISDSVKDM